MNHSTFKNIIGYRTHFCYNAFDFIYFRLIKKYYTISFKNIIRPFSFIFKRLFCLFQPIPFLFSRESYF